jgi:hypothetical protein
MEKIDNKDAQRLITYAARYAHYEQNIIPGVSELWRDKYEAETGILTEVFDKHVLDAVEAAAAKRRLEHERLHQYYLEREAEKYRPKGEHPTPAGVLSFETPEDAVRSLFTPECGPDSWSVYKDPQTGRFWANGWYSTSGT